MGKEWDLRRRMGKKGEKSDGEERKSVINKMRERTGRDSGR